MGHHQRAHEPRYYQGLEEGQCGEVVEGVEFLGSIALPFLLLGVEYTTMCGIQCGLLVLLFGVFPSLLPCCKKTKLI